MKRILQAGWFAAVMGVVCYGLVSWIVWQKQSATSSAQSRDRGPGPSWEFANPELDQLIQELHKKQKALDEREEKLNELEHRLQAERREIEVVVQSTERLRKEFDEGLVRVREEETANLKKLAKVYSAMEPNNAANVLKELTDDQVVKIMVFMKENETAPILEKMSRLGQNDAKRVAMISERLRLAVFRDNRPKPKSS